MPANTIRRIHKPSAAHVAPDVTLRFTSGLEVHPADCPRGIQAYPHWLPGPDGRAVCKCTVLAAETATAALCEECQRSHGGPGRLCTACRRAEDGPYDEELELEEREQREPLDDDAFAALMATGYADDAVVF